MLKPGVTLHELVHGGHALAPEYRAQKYSCRFHGVALCDEWPLVPYPDQCVEGAWDHALSTAPEFPETPSKAYSGP